MIVDIIQTALGLGLFYLIAVILLFVSVYLEQMAASRKPEEGERECVDFGGFVLMVVTTITPALLLLHAFLMTGAVPMRLRIIAVAFPIGAVVLGAIAGRIAGMAWKSGAGIAKALVLPAALVAFVVAIYVTLPSIHDLVDLLNGRVVPVRVFYVRP